MRVLRWITPVVVLVEIALVLTDVVGVEIVVAARGRDQTTGAGSTVRTAASSSSVRVLVARPAR